MRISDLAYRADVPLSAVKYYQREGLLPAGEKSAPNQTSYDEVHVQRIRLIRALLGVGRLSISATREVLDAMDGNSTAGAFAVAQHALSASSAEDPAPSTASRERVIAVARTQGWAMTDNNPGIDIAARALDGLAAIDFSVPDAYLASYASAAASAAAADLHVLAILARPERITEVMVVGTVLGDPLFAGLRRIAQEDATHTHFSVDLDKKDQER